MPRVSVTPEERAFIAERISRFADETEEELRWQIPYVQQHGGLPLHVGWTETLGIRPDGELIRWLTEDWSGAREFPDGIWERIALVLGARRYPLLRRLIPSRPATARDCDVCQGTGTFPLHPDVICACGGVGWIDSAD